MKDVVIMTCKGTVKGNIVILEKNVMLPEGSVVEVKVLGSEPDLNKRKLVVDSLIALGEKLKGRGINLGRCVTEAREELENQIERVIIDASVAIKWINPSER
jgi:hypothetical protein